MSKAKQHYRIGTESPQLNKRTDETTDESHARRKAMLIPLIEEMVATKELAKAYGTFTLEVIWRNGEIAGLDITNHASYK